MLKIVFVCGMSGAGKTTAQNTLEDLGYMCIDNMPPTFIELVIDLMKERDVSKRNNIGFVFDVKFHEARELVATYEKLRKRDDIDLSLLFLDADDQALLGRYRETRRMHPLAASDLSLVDGIDKERALLKEFKEEAEVIIDTTHLSTKELTWRMRALFGKENTTGVFNVTFVSFGFKYGIPNDADFLLDVRFLPNPFYEKALRVETGLAKSVSTYVLETEEGITFRSHTETYLTYLLAQYAKDKRNNVIIAIGCTGGQHRSVAIVQALAQHFKDDYIVFVKHRDMDLNQAEVKKRYDVHKA